MPVGLLLYNQGLSYASSSLNLSHSLHFPGSLGLDQFTFVWNTFLTHIILYKRLEKIEMRTSVSERKILLRAMHRVYEREGRNDTESDSKKTNWTVTVSYCFMVAVLNFRYSGCWVIYDSFDLISAGQLLDEF